MEFHKLAELFPLMHGGEYDQLKADIVTNGLLEPIWLYENKILDGRNRYLACADIGVEAEYKTYTATDPLGFVLSMNLHRRHLNETQRAVVASKLADMKQGERTDIEPSANLPKVSQVEAANKLNVSERTVRTVKAIERDAPELMPKLESGEMTAHEANKIIRTAEIKEQRMEMARAGESIAVSDRWSVTQADIATWQAPRQYDFIITDPPYPKEYLYLYEILASRAKEWLKPGGLLIALSAHYWINEIYKMMDNELDYFWTAAYLVPGESAGVFQKHIIPQWKPLIMYQLKDKPFKGRQFSDVFKSDANDKQNHKWGQSVSGMFDIISHICLPGQYILDPFCGAGTTGIAALMHGCLFDGIDVDIESVNISKGRLSNAK